MHLASKINRLDTINFFSCDIKSDIMHLQCGCRNDVENHTVGLIAVVLTENKV